MRLIQHKREAYWFYRYLSRVYEVVNRLFWTPSMRDRSLALAELDDPDLITVDVGAGTGFTTEGVIARVRADRLTMLDQSPHQLAVAARKTALADVRRVIGDAEDLPFEADTVDRYVSAGSIEYWPDPQRAIAEAYRVLREGGVALIVGPVAPANQLARRLADLWMLFPAEREYREWFERAGFAEIRVVGVAPEWHRGPADTYAVAIAGRKPAPGPAAVSADRPPERRDEPLSVIQRLRFAGRFVVGSIAGAAFIPIAAALALRHRLSRR
jgi:MPBQ/MSBQ methyltransferase